MYKNRIFRKEINLPLIFRHVLVSVSNVKPIGHVQLKLPSVLTQLNEQYKPSESLHSSKSILINDF